MITRDFLLNKGFEFRIFEGSKFPNGEYALRTSDGIIRIGWSDIFNWDIKVRNYEKNITFEMDRQQNISVEKFNNICELCEINLINKENDEN